MSQSLFRPETLDELIGCSNIKTAIRVSLVSAIKQNREFPHTLIYGGPGLGKTTISNIIAKESGSDFKVLISDVIKKKTDVQTLLSSLNSEGYDEDGNIVGMIKPTVLFLDEIHQLNRDCQEAFFQAMEDNVFTATGHNRVNGKEEKIVYWVPRFTLIGATTRAGQLDQPFIERFKLIFTLNLYSNEEIGLIIKRYCLIKQVQITDEAIVEIAVRSRGVARKCINFIERCIDTSIFISPGDTSRLINKDVVQKSFEILGIDSSGLEQLDIQILLYLYKIYPQKVGVARLAGILNITETALKEIIEPYLLRQGLIEATPSGRIISESGMEYLERTKAVKGYSSASKFGGKIKSA